MNDQWLGVAGQSIDGASAAAWLAGVADVQRRIVAADPAAARDLLSNLRLAGAGGQAQAALQRYVQLGESLQKLQALASAIAQVPNAQWTAWTRLLEPLASLPQACLLSVPLSLKAPGAVGPLFFAIDGAVQLDVELNAVGAPVDAKGRLLRLGADGQFKLTAGATIPWVSGVFGGSLGGSVTASAGLECDLWTPHADSDIAIAAVADALSRLCDPFDLTAVRDLPSGSALRLAGSGALEVEVNADVAVLQAAGAVSAASVGYSASKSISGKVQVEVACLGQQVVRVSAYRQRGELTTQALKATVGLSLSNLGIQLGDRFAAALADLLQRFHDPSLLQHPGTRIAAKLKPAVDARRNDAIDGPWIKAAEQRLSGRVNGDLSAYLGTVLDTDPAPWHMDTALATRQASQRLSDAFVAFGGMSSTLSAALSPAIAAGISDWQAALTTEVGAFDDAARARLQQSLAAAGINLPALPADAKARTAALLSGLMTMMQQGRAQLAQALNLLHAAADAAIELRIEHGTRQQTSQEACIVVDIDAHGDLTQNGSALAQAYRAAFAGNFTALQRLAATGDARILDIRGSLREVLSRRDQTRVALSLLNVALLDDALYASETTATRAFDGSVELLSRASFQRRRALFGEAQTVRCVDVFALIGAQRCAGVTVGLTVSQQDQQFNANEFRAFVAPLEQATLLPVGTAQRIAALLAAPRGPSLFGRGEITAGLQLGLPQLQTLFAVSPATLAVTAARHLIDRVYASAVGQIMSLLAKVPSWPSDPAQAALSLATRLKSDADFTTLATQICQADGTPALSALLSHHKAYLRQLWSAGRSAYALSAFLGILRGVSQAAPTPQQCEDLQLQASQQIASWLRPAWEEVLDGMPSARFVALLQTLAELAATNDGSVQRVALWFSADDQSPQLLLA